MTLRAKILRVLRSSHLPCPTPELALLVAFGKPNARALVWAVPREMERVGQVRKVGTRRVKGTRGGWTRTLWSAA